MSDTNPGHSLDSRPRRRARPRIAASVLAASALGLAAVLLLSEWFAASAGGTGAVLSMAFPPWPGRDQPSGAGTPDPWASAQSAAAEVASRKQPVDYATILGRARVLLAGENHANTAIRAHLAGRAEHIRHAGFTHYGIEAGPAGQPAIDALHRGERVDLSRVDLGPGGADYELAVRAMAAQGLRIVFVDVDTAAQQKVGREGREQHITDHIAAALASDPDTRILVLIGGFHTGKTPMTDGIKSTRTRLDEAGIDTVTVEIVGGTLSIPRILTDAAAAAGAADEEFMLDLRGDQTSRSVPFGAGNTDWVIHLPQRGNTDPHSPRPPPWGLQDTPMDITTYMPPYLAADRLLKRLATGHRRQSTRHENSPRIDTPTHSRQAPGQPATQPAHRKVLPPAEQQPDSTPEFAQLKRTFPVSDTPQNQDHRENTRLTRMSQWSINWTGCCYLD
jgi:hypothetical protein